jgi:5-methylcytosine-specific restriction endonuclease McrA
MKTIQQLIDIIRSPSWWRFYKTTEWLNTRAIALNRDHYECQRCAGKWKSDEPIKRVRLSRAKYVHHIKPLLQYPALCLDLDNLVSLCFACHETVEQRSLTKEKKEPLTAERW